MGRAKQYYRQIRTFSALWPFSALFNFANCLKTISVHNLAVLSMPGTITIMASPFPGWQIFFNRIGWTCAKWCATGVSLVYIMYTIGFDMGHNTLSRDSACIIFRDSACIILTTLYVTLLSISAQVFKDSSPLVNC